MHFTRGIDRTGDVIVLRRGCEGTDLKPTETEEYARRRFAERAGCSYRIGNVDPTVAGLFRPSRAPEGAQRYSGLPASRNSVAGNIRCIGVRRIDDRFDSLCDQPLREAVHAANPPTRVASGSALGLIVRPARERIASKRLSLVRLSPAISRASSDASVVPPRMRTRMCSAPSSSNLIASGNCTPGRWLSIVGIGEDGVAGLSDAAKRIIANAQLVVGGARHLALATELLRGETLTWSSPMAPALDTIVRRRGSAVTVLATGDPFHYGVGKQLAERVSADEILCLPQPSAFSLAASRLGWPVQHCALVTLHGRALEGIVRYLQPGARILALSWDGSTPAKLAKLLAARGLEQSQMTVLEAIGGPAEKVRHAIAADFAIEDITSLNTIAVEVVAGADARALSLSPGLDDGLFESDGH